MKKLFEMANLFVSTMENAAEEVAKGFNSLLWAINLPIFVDKEGILFRTDEEQGVIIPAEMATEMATAIGKLQANLEEAQKEAEKKLKLEGWSKAEEEYKAAKMDLVNQGIFGVPMHEIAYGQKVAEFRQKASEGDARYDSTQRWYWDMLPTRKERFYAHRNALGDSIIPGIPEMYATPDLPEGHPFKDTYWEEMRALLPNWVVRYLAKEGLARVPIEKKANRSNGVWDSNAMKGRTKEAEQTEDDTLFALLSARVKGFLDFEEIRDCDNNPRELLKKLNIYIQTGDIKTYAVAYRLVELVNAGWLTSGDIQKVNEWKEKEYNDFLSIYTKGVACNKRQKENGIIDVYEGEWYTLSFEANLDKEDMLTLLKEGMISNLKNPVYSRMFKAQSDAMGCWKKYGQLSRNRKKNPAATKQELILMAPSLPEMREKAGKNLQEKLYTLRKLAETSKYEISTNDKEWDNFLIEARKEAMQNIEMLSDTAIHNRTLAGAVADDNIVDLAMVKAAYTIFVNTSKEVCNCFGIDYK